MAERTPDADAENMDITVKNDVSTVPDSARAADLFSRILGAVREQRAEDDGQRNKERESAA